MKNDNLAYRASFSRFCYWIEMPINFFSNEHMILKLDNMTHFAIIFTIIQSFLELQTFSFLQNMQAVIYEYGLETGSVVIHALYWTVNYIQTFNTSTLNLSLWLKFWYVRPFQ